MKTYTTKEKTKNAIYWIDTLITTDLKQTIQKLGNKEDGFCCLGLGCFLSNINYLSEEGINAEFARSVGLINEAGAFKDHKEFTIKDFYERAYSLVNLNDTFKFSFKEIGKFIIDNLEHIFIEELIEELKTYYNE